MGASTLADKIAVASTARFAAAGVTDRHRVLHRVTTSRQAPARSVDVMRMAASLRARCLSTPPLDIGAVRSVQLVHLRQARRPAANGIALGMKGR